MVFIAIITISLILIVIYLYKKSVKESKNNDPHLYEKFYHKEWDNKREFHD